MKKNILLLTAMLITAVTTASAQAYRHSRYYNPHTGHLDYDQAPAPTQRPPVTRSSYSPSYWGRNSYVGFRIGPSFSTLTDDYKGSGSATGINAGIVLGTAISPYLPLYFETGLSYTEKGASNMTYYYNDDSHITNNVKLGYLEMPLTIKYAYSPDGHFSVQPFAGGYLAYGCNSSFKGDRSVKMFGDKGELQRFDGGLRVGLGIGFDVLYAELAYDYGLTNIAKDSKTITHNSSLQLNFGVNF